MGELLKRFRARLISRKGTRRSRTHEVDLEQGSSYHAQLHCKYILIQEETLKEIYKRYFFEDEVFLNELRIISKRSLNQDHDDKDWVTVGRERGLNTQNGRYNFLEDKKCKLILI